MKHFSRYILSAVLTASLCGMMCSCSLEENNPGGFTFENLSKTTAGFQTIVNNIYFGLERSFYGNVNKIDFMAITEAETDLWTTPRNKDNTSTQYFWYYAGGTPNTTYTLNFLYSLYDGIGSCNKVLQYGDLPPYKTEEERNSKLAEARFMRALYYYHGVEQFGGITVVTEKDTEIGEGVYTPERKSPKATYDEIIIPDLLYAIEWLPKGDDSYITRPTKKSAIGLLARCYLQATRWTEDAEYYTNALKYAKMLIDDMNAGGASYNAYMYDKYEDVFAEANNYTNKEALWKHAYYSDATYNGSSNGAHVLNMCHELFRAQITSFPARENNADTYETWEGSKNGSFMPTQHLISLFVNSDNTLDPRFKKIFQNVWLANKSYTWTKDMANQYDKDASVIGQTVAVGDTAIEFIMPQDPDYAAKKAQRYTSKHMIIDYADVYNDAGKTVEMFHKYFNTTEAYKADGTNENFHSNFYPSMTKYNTTKFFESNRSKIRFGNTSAMQIIRMPEMMLIAAEADLKVNGGSNALSYINMVRKRAGAKELTGTVTIRTILDERAREFCGEFMRFYDLARTGMLKDDNYLNETNPSVGKYFKAEYVLRPFDTSTFLPSINNGSEYQNGGYASGAK